MIMIMGNLHSSSREVQTIIAQKIRTTNQTARTIEEVPTWET